MTWTIPGLGHCEGNQGAGLAGGLADRRLGERALGEQALEIHFLIEDSNFIAGETEARSVGAGVSPRAPSPRQSGLLFISCSSLGFCEDRPYGERGIPRGSDLRDPEPQDVHGAHHCVPVSWKFPPDTDCVKDLSLSVFAGVRC